MTKIFRSLFLVFILMISAWAAAEAASEGDENNTGTSGLPLPRFASLRASDVNMRTGPGTRYPIEWVLTRQGMPVEITAEYEVWRRVRDPDGDEGWVHKNALSGRRAALVTGKGVHELRDDDNDQAPLVAHLTESATGRILKCEKDWCKLDFSGHRGWLKKSEFWGAYPGEIFD
jgi:SH3-like domain-containing protein